MEKREMNIANIVENSPKKAHALYMLKLKLKREIAKAKKAMWEKSLLAPSLGSDEDSLPDDPWFSKSPEEKHADVIQEEHGQYENIDSGRRLPGLNPEDDFTGQWETGFVGEREGEEEGAEAANKFLSGATDYHDYDDPSTFLDFSKKDEGGSALDRISAEDRRRAELAESHASYGSRHQDPDAGTPFAGLKSLFASDEDSAPATKSKGLSPMQKYGAQLITDIFAEKEEAPQQSIGASPLTPGRTFDMSYLKSRPKKERYRNRGLLGRA